MEFQNFLKSEKRYKPNDIDEVLSIALQGQNPVSTNTKQKYYNIPCAFDIETSSFMQEDEKVAIMYIWQFGINGLVIIGRTWKEFSQMIERIVDTLELNHEKRLIVYVHNLGYEFQFMRKHFKWDKVFSIDTRKPIYALTKSGIEFRCSYILSGYSLLKLGDELHKYKIQKKVGDLDYSKIRTNKTPITEKEYGYCVNDVKVVMAYIQERIERDHSIVNIPHTKTGYVRRYVKNACFYESGKSRKFSRKRQKYLEFMSTLRIAPNEYQQLKRAFQGGFTHCNPFCTGKLIENVESYDFTSSYPAVMVSEMFPMSSSEKIQIKSKEEFETNLKLYCCLFDIEIDNLQSIVWFESYLSRSRCWGVKNAIVNNGRIVSAEHLYTTLTEQDYMIITKMYEWEHIKIGNFRRYKRGYLPTDFIKAILKLYADKTTLKGVAGKEVEYLLSKGMINACYGMAVTDIVRDDIIYIDQWSKQSPDLCKAIEKYNNSKSRFLFYPWGVWVTAYARRNLFTGILEYKEDYIYSDTDSIKIRNSERHKKYIDKYNKMIITQLYKAADFHHISYKMIAPKTIKGIEKPLGIWEDEGMYTRFKSLGAKRYMTEKDGKISITVAGLNKKVCVPYMIEKWNDKIFENFKDGMYIPKGFTGKNTHTYIDEERKGIVKDYLGNYAEYDELSSIHLSESDYTLSISREYADYLSGLWQDEY